LLEREVIPEFYTRNQSGIPAAWVKRMRESMAQLTLRFSADGAVREYTEQHYLPAAAAYHLRAANKGAIGNRIADWRKSLEQKWAALRFGGVRVQTHGDRHMFEAQVCLNGVDPQALRVELYADGVNGSAPTQLEMKLVESPACEACMGTYQASVPANRLAADYTVRVVPQFAEVAVPLEADLILWQR
jgi:starch phosphorylase